MDRKAPRLVRLKVDLTRYDPRLVVGAEGITTAGDRGMASFDRFTEVVFDRNLKLPILFESLEVVR